MVKNKGVIINQTLHGYKDGHKLLACSLDLSAIEKNTLLVQSDYSGTGRESNFQSYLTGYPVNNGKFYAFAMTWYADEMPRPGCVWTHTLLIDVSNLWMLEDVNCLIGFFKRPEKNDYKDYLASIELNLNFFQRRNKKLSPKYYYLLSQLYQKEQSLIILSDSSQEFEEDVLNIWSYQWPRLKRNFKFCLGSMSVKYLGNDPFDLQVMPFSRERHISNQERPRFNVVDSSIETFTLEKWAELYKNSDSQRVLEFMTKFGSDVSLNKRNFIALYFAYEASVSKDFSNVTDLLNIVNITFKNEDDALLLKNFIVSKATDDAFESFEVYRTILSSPSLKKVNWKINSTLIAAHNAGFLKGSEMVALAHILKKNYGFEILSELLNSLDLSLWVDDIDLYSELPLQEIAKQQNSKLLGILWTKPLEIQDYWWKYFREFSLKELNNVVFSLLENQNTSYLTELLNIYGEASLFGVLYDWIYLTNKELPEDCQDLLSNNQIVAFRSLTERTEFNQQLLLIVTELFTVANQEWKNLSTLESKLFIDKISKFRNQETVTGIYTFFISLCFSNTFNDCEILLIELFDSLYYRFDKNIIDVNTYNRFKYSTINEVYRLIEEDPSSRLYKQRFKIPDWNRTELLVFGLLNCFARFKWPIEVFIYVTRDDKIFKHLVKNAVQIKSVGKRLKSLKKKGIIKNEEFYKILKEYL
ncbi:MAG: hypothetical protein ACLGH8_03385 [Bacteroidia bacterium]